MCALLKTKVEKSLVQRHAYACQSQWIRSFALCPGESGSAKTLAPETNAPVKMAPQQQAISKRLVA